MILKILLKRLWLQVFVFIACLPIAATGQFLPHARMTDSKVLENFSASSSIQSYGENLLVVGDDENEVFVLDSTFRIKERILLYGNKGRQTKSTKLDLEASTILPSRPEQLLVFGSGSTPGRNLAFAISLDGTRHVRRIEGYSEFLRILQTKVSQVNIEGATVFNDNFLFVNRGNLDDPNNRLITIPVSQLLENKVSNIWIRDIALPITVPLKDSTFAGVSEISLTTSGMLLFTFTQELTTNNYDDGVIGHSYLGWTGFLDDSSDITSELRLDGMLDLSEIDPVFAKQKIEGVCMKPQGKGVLIFYFVADNDGGVSNIFKVEIGK
jgi:hypothetical protein